jgi:hypothetical protein
MVGARVFPVSGVRIVHNIKLGAFRRLQREAISGTINRLQAGAATCYAAACDSSWIKTSQVSFCLCKVAEREQKTHRT